MYPPSAAALAAEPPRAEPPPEEAPRAPSGLELFYTSHFARLQRALDDARPAEAPRAAAPAAAPAADSRTPPQGAADAGPASVCCVLERGKERRVHAVHARGMLWPVCKGKGTDRGEEADQEVSHV